MVNCCLRPPGPADSGGKGIKGAVSDLTDSSGEGGSGGGIKDAVSNLTGGKTGGAKDLGL